MQSPTKETRWFARACVCHACNRRRLFDHNFGVVTKIIPTTQIVATLSLSPSHCVLSAPSSPSRPKSDMEYQPNQNNWSRHEGSVLYPPHEAGKLPHLQRGVPEDVPERCMPTKLEATHRQLLDHHVLTILPKRAQLVRYNEAKYGKGGVVLKLTPRTVLTITVPLEECLQIGVNASAVHRGEEDEVSTYVRQLLRKLGCHRNRLEYMSNSRGNSKAVHWTLFLFDSELRPPTKPDFVKISAKL